MQVFVKKQSPSGRRVVFSKVVGIGCPSNRYQGSAPRYATLRMHATPCVLMAFAGVPYPSPFRNTVFPHLGRIELTMKRRALWDTVEDRI